MSNSARTYEEITTEISNTRNLRERETQKVWLEWSKKIDALEKDLHDREEK